MIQLKKLFTLILLASGATSAFAVNFPADIQKANILHCFDWKFSDIQAELPRIAEAGFGAVQVSPVQGNCGNNAEWFYAYLPWDFKFRDDKANGNGTRAQLRSLCDEADKYGIKIIVDVVANHVNPASAYRDAWWSSNGRERDNGGCDYNNRYSITHGNLGSYRDVNSESSEVQQRIVAFLEDLKTLGVKGIRWDAAKHIGLPSEGCEWWKKVSAVSGLWHYGEILDNPGTNSDSEWKVMREYTNYIGVTDNALSGTLLNMLKNGKMPVYYGNLSNPKDLYGQGIDGNKMVLWGESHDTYSNDGGATKNVDQSVIDRAYLITACREKETALYFSRPSEKANNRIRMGVKGSTHALESKAIAAANLFRIKMIDKPEKMKIKYGDSGYLVAARLNGGAFIMLPKATSRTGEFENPGGYLPAGEYTDPLSGNKFSVTSSTIKGTVGADGVAVLYSQAGVEEIDSAEETPEPIYYDLTGRRVENPEKGIYIRVCGTKATKIIL